jgi:hypothetical protein
MKPKIEKGIPMPARHKLAGITEIMKKMEIGDSIVVHSGARPNMKGYADRLGFKITTQKINEEQVRVWRIA